MEQTLFTTLKESVTAVAVIMVVGIFIKYLQRRDKLSEKLQIFTNT